MSFPQFISWAKAKKPWKTAKAKVKEQARDGIVLAAAHGHESAVKFLLANGTNINERDASGWSALHRAIRGGHEAIVSLLVQNGADVNSKDGDGCPAIIHAAICENPRMMETLLDAGAEVDATDKSGWTALRHAGVALYGPDEATIEVLVRKGKVNKIDVHNFTVNGGHWNGFRAVHSAQDILKFPDLCAMCRKIDFKRLMIRVSGDEENERADVGIRIVLGYVDEILRRRSSCKICDLVLKAASLSAGREPKAIFAGHRTVCRLERTLLYTLHDVFYEGEIRDEVGIHRLDLRIEKDFPDTDYPSPDHDSSSDTIESSTDDGSDTEEYFTDIKFQPYKETTTSSVELGCLQGMGRQVKPSLDIQIVKTWLHDCDDLHGDECHSPKWLGASEHPQFLRFIDVKRGCIVDAPPKCRYIALSYVWGADQNGRSTKGNIGQLREEHGLKNSNLPKTILDSINLVSALGERYLWVDRLCIVQDDELDVAKQITQMDLVYARALFTIMATSGSSASSGLPGLTKGPRDIVQRVVEVDDGVFLMECLKHSYFENQGSPLNMRGWTYQERLLSRRALIFTQEQIYWRCASTTRFEETVLEPRTPKLVIECNDFGCNELLDFGPKKFEGLSINDYVTEFSNRQLTNHSDALDAFSGIIRRMEYRSGEKYHWGLPHTRFDHVLSWSGGKERRLDLCRIITSSGVVRKVPFPTWSWLGWKGQVIRSASHSKVSELRFYKLGIDGIVEEIKSTGIKNDSLDLERSEEIERERDGKKEYDRKQNLREKHRAKLRSQWKGDTRIASPVIIQSKGPPLPPQPSIHNLELRVGKEHEKIESTTATGNFEDTGRLVFWTSYARVTACSIPDDGDLIPLIIGGEQIEYHFEVPESERNFLKEKWAKEKILAMDLIVVSRNDTTWLYPHVEPGEEEGVLPPTLNLLLIEWSSTELNVARRVGYLSIVRIFLPIAP